MTSLHVSEDIYAAFIVSKLTLETVETECEVGLVFSVYNLVSWGTIL